MSSSAGPIRVSRPRRSSELTSNGSTASSTGTDDGARIGASTVILLSGDWDMALYLGSGERKRKVSRRHGRTCSGHPRLASRQSEDVDARDKPGNDEILGFRRSGPTGSL